uniref:Uncharacterized protein n=1 Tax=Terrapene triunguis TaxID=2587831 RepID=A0A674IN77_9SAUR
KKLIFTLSQNKCFLIFWSQLHPLNIPLLLCFCSQINTRIANEKYLRSHKEVELLLSGFLSNWSLENLPPTPDMQLLAQLPHRASVSPPQEMVFPSLI